MEHVFDVEVGRAALNARQLTDKTVLFKYKQSNKTSNTPLELVMPRLGRKGLVLTLEHPFGRYSSIYTGDKISQKAEMSGLVFQSFMHSFDITRKMNEMRRTKYKKTD